MILRILRDDFENTAIQIAMEKGYDYVVCGHIHHPQIRTIENDQKRVTYLNSGDWVENLTALEYKWGAWTIYEYDESDYRYLNPRLQVENPTPVIVQEEKSEEVLAAGQFTAEELFQHIIERPSGIGRSK